MLFWLLIAVMSLFAFITWLDPQGKWKHFLFGLQVVIIVVTICLYVSDTNTTNFLKAIGVSNTGVGL